MNEAMIVAYVGEIARKLCIASQKGFDVNFDMSSDGVWIKLECKDSKEAGVAQIAISFNHEGTLESLKEVSERTSKILRDHMIRTDREQLQKDWEGV